MYLYICMCMCMYYTINNGCPLLDVLGGSAHTNVIVLIYQFWVDDMTIVSEITIETVAFPGSVVADALVGAIYLTQVAIFPRVETVLRRDIVTICFNRTSPWIVRRGTMSWLIITK